MFFPIKWQGFRFFCGAILTTALLLWMTACILKAPDVTGWGCKGNQDCLEPLLCNDGICAKPCFSNSDCASGEACTNSFCLKKNQTDGGLPSDELCVFKGDEVCNGEDDDCNGQVDDGIKCSPEGGECDVYAKPSIGCAKGLTCTTFSTISYDAPRICLVPCKDKACPNSLTCSSVSKVCQQTQCQQDSDCIYNGRAGVDITYRCVTVASNQKRCQPRHPKGSVGFGEKCSPTQGKNCKDSLFCIRKHNEPDGFCSIRCGTDNDCKSTKVGAKCEVFADRFSVCK